jgi:restriction system protein
MIPTQKEIEPKLLLALHKLGGTSGAKDVIERLIKNLGISDEEQRITRGKSKTPKFVNDCRWARENLKKQDFIKKNSPRGIWELTDDGKKAVAELLDTGKIQTLRFDLNEESEEILEESEEIDELGIIRKIDPYQFERLCTKIFEAMNFKNVEYTKKSHDKGIDGFGDLVFGLVRFRVVFQAKRYKDGNKVSIEEVQKLGGAMSQYGSEKAVFLTTSDFTSSAKESAKKQGIEIFNGEEILELLRKYKIGFRERIEYDIDPEFFEKL